MQNFSATSLFAYFKVLFSSEASPQTLAQTWITTLVAHNKPKGQGRPTRLRDAGCSMLERQENDIPFFIQHPGTSIQYLLIA